MTHRCTFRYKNLWEVGIFTNLLWLLFRNKDCMCQLFLLTSLFFFSFSCSSVKEVHPQNEINLSIQELFLKLPGEAFYFTKYKPSLSLAERQIMLKSVNPEQASALGSDFLMDTVLSNDRFLAFTSFANDTGFSLSLKTWTCTDGSTLLAVNVTVGDMCCDYSRLRVFDYKEASFHEVPQQVFPKLTIEDFVVDVKEETIDLLPSPIDLSINMYPQSDTLELSIQNTPMLYELSDYHGIQPELIHTDQRLKVVWRNDRFRIHEE